MPKDPNLTSDTCLFYEAVAGDGGTHVPWPPSQFWESPDIDIPGVLPGPVPTGPQNIKLVTHLKPNCALPNEEDVVQFDLYVSVPAAVMLPSNDGSTGTKLIKSDIVGAVGDFVAGKVTKNIVWNVPTSPPASNTAEQPGHKCLIARCYPDSLSPDSLNINHLPEDQHYAQHNICIVTCMSPCGLDAQTANPDPKQRAEILLRVVPVLKPTKNTLNQVLPGLKRVKGFKRIVRRAPPSFQLDIKDCEARIENSTCKNPKTGRYGRMDIPHFDARVVLRPKQIVKFRFSSDLERSQVGDAHLFNILHYGSNQKVQGGITVALVRIKP